MFGRKPDNEFQADMENALRSHSEWLRGAALEDLNANRRFYVGLAAASLLAQGTFNEPPWSAVGALASFLALLTGSIWLLRFQRLLERSFEKFAAERRAWAGDPGQLRDAHLEDAAQADAAKPTDKELAFWHYSTLAFLVISALSALPPALG